MGHPLCAYWDQAALLCSWMRNEEFLPWKSHVLFLSSVTHNRLSAAQKGMGWTFWGKNTLNLDVVGQICTLPGLCIFPVNNVFLLLTRTAYCWFWLWIRGSQDSWRGSGTLHSFLGWYLKGWTDPHMTYLKTQPKISVNYLSINIHLYTF